MIVSVGVIAYNEKTYLPLLLEDLLKQDYDLHNVELLLVDSISSDDTKAIMRKFQTKHKSDFYDIKILDNEKKLQAAGWNIVFREFTGDIVIRVDAHARIPFDFISANVEAQEKGYSVCGGERKSIVNGNGYLSSMLLCLEESIFGSGIASYRNKSHVYSEEVNTIAHTCYNKKVIDEVGFFNESLHRCEDNEYHYRVRESNHKIYKIQNIYSEFYIRNSFKAFMQQKYANGKAIGSYSKVNPRIFSLFNFVPFLFVVCLILGLGLFIGGCLSEIFILKLPFIMLMGLYGILVVLMGFIGAFKYKKLSFVIVIPICTFILHCMYGFGTINGFFFGE